MKKHRRFDMMLDNELISEKARSDLASFVSDHIISQVTKKATNNIKVNGKRFYTKHISTYR